MTVSFSYILLNCYSPAFDKIISHRYNSKTNFAVASKNAASSFEKKDVRFLVFFVLICVFEKMSMACERFVIGRSRGEAVGSVIVRGLK